MSFLKAVWPLLLEVGQRKGGWDHGQGNDKNTCHTQQPALKLSMGTLSTKPQAKEKLFISLDKNRLNSSRLTHRSTPDKRLWEPRPFAFLPVFGPIVSIWDVSQCLFKISGRAKGGKNMGLIILWSKLNRNHAVIKPHCALSWEGPAQLASPRAQLRRKKNSMDTVMTKVPFWKFWVTGLNGSSCSIQHTAFLP